MEEESRKRIEAGDPDQGAHHIRPVRRLRKVDSVQRDGDAIEQGAPVEIAYGTTINPRTEYKEVDREEDDALQENQREMRPRELRNESRAVGAVRGPDLDFRADWARLGEEVHLRRRADRHVAKAGRIGNPSGRKTRGEPRQLRQTWDGPESEHEGRRRDEVIGAA